MHTTQSPHPVAPAAELPPTLAAPGGLTRGARLVLLLAPFLVPSATVATGLSVFDRLNAPAAAPVVASPPVDGSQLYALHCARCHGSRGDAQGPISHTLNPTARHFGVEKFRLSSTANGNPTDDDLMYVLKHGIPGSAMPNFPELSEPELRALVAQVRTRTVAGLRQKIRRALEADGDLDEAEVNTSVRKQSTVGAPVAVPTPFPEPTADRLARGKTLFAANCAACHGPQGRGDGPQVKDMKNDNGRPTRPRDLTTGSYKGGSSPERLYIRLLVGLPGTPMPASVTLKPDDLCDLVHYVREMAAKPPAE